jgi:hypothetical protein
VQLVVVIVACWLLLFLWERADPCDCDREPVRCRLGYSCMCDSGLRGYSRQRNASEREVGGSTEGRGCLGFELVCRRGERYTAG